MKNNYYRMHAVLLRGGRMTKFKGQAASFAPSMGRILSGVSALAIGATVSLGGAAQAGSCPEILPRPTAGTKTYTCSGSAAATPTEAEVNVNATVLGDLARVVVTTQAGFGVNSAQTGISLSGVGVEFTDSHNSQITGARKGIDALAPTDIQVFTNGTVTGQNDGVSARQFSVPSTTRGDITIHVADVTGTNGFGITAIGETGGDRLSVTSSGQVTGGENGVEVEHRGSGEVKVDVNKVKSTKAFANASASGARGIRVDNQNGAGTSVTATGLVEGAVYGIEATNTNQALSIDVKDVTSSDGSAILAKNSGTDLTVTASGTIKGQGKQERPGVVFVDTKAVLDAQNRGTGALTVSVHNVTAEDANVDNIAISAINYSAGTDLSITASGKVESKKSIGIWAQQEGSGSLSIDVADVTGEDGISANSTSSSRSMSIKASGNIMVDSDAILATHGGSGKLTIDVRDVISNAPMGDGQFGIGKGIHATSSNGSGLSISASGVVQGASFGIQASNGSQALTINAKDVSSTGFTAIQAENTSGSTNTLIAVTGSVTGYRDGISARSYGSGELSIDVADVIGTTRSGIEARTSAASTDLSVKASGPIQGGRNGVRAINDGRGKLMIDVANVTGTSAYGIEALNKNAGTDLTIAASGSVSGGAAGVRARNRGTGALTVNLDDVSATRGMGIFASQSTQGSDLTITASGQVNASSEGIYAVADGAGDLSVDVQGIESQNAAGLGFKTSNSSGKATIRVAGKIEAANDGITGTHDGTGALDVDVADVTSTTGAAVDLNSSGTTLEFTATGAVQAETTGVRATNTGTDALNIDVANVTANKGSAIRANSYGTDLSITASGLLQAGDSGVEVKHDGSGAVKIKVADVTARGSASGPEDRRKWEGIGFNGGGTDVSISSSGKIQAQSTGIRVDHRGSGAVTINAVDVQGGTRSGVAAGTTGSGLSVTTKGAVSGDEYGIIVSNRGTGATSIDVSGSVQSDGTAISIFEAASSTLELKAGAQIQSASTDIAIVDSSGDSSVVLYDGAALAGRVSLGGGVDVLKVEEGADITKAGFFDGGAGDEDALIFSGYTGGLDHLGFAGFETLTAQDGATLALTTAHVSVLQKIEVKGGSTISAKNRDFSFGNSLQVDTDGRFLAGAGGLGSVSLAKDVLNNGRISLADDAAGDQLRISGNLSGNGIIGLDVNLTDGTNDQVQIAGDSAGTNQGLEVTAMGSTVDRAQNFTLVMVAGTSTESDFQLVNADFVTNNGVQAISDGEVAYQLEYESASGSFLLTPFANNLVNENPGGDFLAAGVQQFSNQMTFGTTLERAMTATHRGDSNVNTVSRALNELASTTRPLVWVEAEGRRESYSVDDRDVETNSGGLRFGAALPVAELGSGTLVGGLEFGISSLSTNVATSLTRADISTDAYDATLSALWIAGSQLYVDGQLRYGHFDSSTRPNGGEAVDTDSSGYGISVEIGKPFITGAGLTLVPQLQLSYSDIDADSVVDLAGGGQRGSLVDGDTLTARLGLRAEHTFATNMILFGQVDYYHAFDNETAVAFGQNTILTERGKNTAALTVGGHVPLSAMTTLFGEVSGESGLGDSSGDYAIEGSVGFELRF